jgi:hypothetical protein
MPRSCEIVGQSLAGRVGTRNPRHTSNGFLKLGITIGQATVGRWMPWRPKVPSPTWRSFLRYHLPDTAAIDMFVVTTATFRLLYTFIVLNLDRRRVVHFEVTANPTQTGFPAK